VGGWTRKNKKNYQCMYRESQDEQQHISLFQNEIENIDNIINIKAKNIINKHNK
jgi:hypothetical protein